MIATGLGPGRRVGGWLLERTIGRGAVGQVHLARDEASGHRVALKLVPLQAGGSAALRERLRRFSLEAAAAQRLQHPDIVRVFGSGTETVDDVLLGWLAMEPLAGVDLVRYTRPARRLPEPVALQVGARIAAALAHAHAAGVQHRDVKPSNVLVDWSADRVVLTDFGLASLQDDDAGERTATGVVLGTPAYMAPEQLAGAPATTAADVHALGVLLFELLCARRPHDDAATLGELLRRVASGPAPDLRDWRPEAPASLAELVGRALAPAPAARPTSAALASALAAEAARGWPDATPGA